MAPPPEQRLSLIGILTSPIRLTLTNPVVTGSLLAAILYAPSRLQTLLPPSLHKYVFSSNFIRILKACLSFQIMKRISESASELALNNWSLYSDGGFGGEKELVLITGGSSGIGEAIARGFVAKGIKVVVLDLQPPVVEFPSNIHFYKADVSSTEDVALAATDIRSQHGSPTVLINNAGIASSQPILTEPIEKTRKMFEVNIISHFICVKEFLPAMVEKDHGHIVSVASTSSFISPSGFVDYSSTKAAAMAFHEGLTSELKFRYEAPNVRTTIIHPAWVRTPLTKPLYTRPDWKLPMLEADHISDLIVGQVMSGRSGFLIAPRSVNFLRTLRGMPVWYQMFIRGKAGDLLAKIGK